MQTTLDLDHVMPGSPPILTLLIEHQTPQFRRRMAELGWREDDEDDGNANWVRYASPEACRDIRALLGKGMLVTTAVTAWYAQATEVSA